MVLLPTSGEYLDKHIIMDDVKMTFCYIGDSRIKLERNPPIAEDPSSP